MKKLFSLFIALALLLGAALADGVDLSAMSLEELQALAAACDAEIISRTAESFEVPTGAYIVGEDVPAGIYRIDYIKSACIVAVYKNADDYEDKDSVFYEGLYKDEPIGKLKLENGNVFVVDSRVQLSLYNGIGW